MTSHSDLRAGAALQCCTACKRPREPREFHVGARRCKDCVRDLQRERKKMLRLSTPVSFADLQLPICTATVTGAYAGLAPFDARPNCQDAYALPSLRNGVRVWPRDPKDVP